LADGGSPSSTALAASSSAAFHSSSAEFAIARFRKYVGFSGSILIALVYHFTAFGYFFFPMARLPFFFFMSPSSLLPELSSSLVVGGVFGVCLHPWMCIAAAAALRRPGGGWQPLPRPSALPATRATARTS